MRVGGQRSIIVRRKEALEQADGKMLLGCYHRKRRIRRCLLHFPQSPQEASSRLGQNVVVVRLEREPAFLRFANLLVTKAGLVFRDVCLLVPAAFLSGIDEELGVT